MYKVMAMTRFIPNGTMLTLHYTLDDFGYGGNNGDGTVVGDDVRVAGFENGVDQGVLPRIRKVVDGCLTFHVSRTECCPVTFTSSRCTSSLCRVSVPVTLAS